MIRVLVVDDHIPTRQKAVSDVSSGHLMEVVAEAATSDEAWKIAQQLLPDVVLLDLHLPGLISTVDLIQRFGRLKNTKVIIYASDGKASDVQDLLDAGALGYILKTDAPALLRMALLMVSRGSKGIISPSLPRHLTRLSGQERTLLRHLTMRGKLPKAAERMGIPIEELTETAEHLAQKLELDDVEKLIKWAKKHGF